MCQALAFGLFLALLLYVAWPYAERFTPDLLAAKEFVPAELFLLLDPVAVLAAALAGRVVGLAVLWMVGLLVLSLLVPRVFCSHLCPLGTTIDLFDRALGRRLRRFHVALPRGWTAAKYMLLGAVVAAALCGVMIAGYLAAIPLATRGFAFVLGPAQLAVLKHASMVRPVGATYWAGVVPLLLVVGLGVLGRRLWCRRLCPTGAAFSLLSLLRLRERQVTEACTRCGKCIEACPFDAIRSDASTRELDCAFCRTCQRVCPVDAIHFSWRRGGARQAPTRGGATRRAFLKGSAVAAGGGLAATAGLAWASEKRSDLLRPPGSVREDRFLRLCIRCGLCLKACPGPVLHPSGLDGGWRALWTPVAVPTWAGCHQDCTFCGDVCPTGAIRPLSLAEKRRTSMGTAAVDTALCLPHRGERDCQLCFEECRAAGYDAIEMREIRLEIGEAPPGVLSPAELEAAARIRAPVLDPAKCVGCGLCEYRCHTAWTRHQQTLPRSAIRVTATGANRP
jgi:ferredoxin